MIFCLWTFYFVVPCVGANKHIYGRFLLPLLLLLLFSLYISTRLSWSIIPLIRWPITTGQPSTVCSDSDHLIAFIIYFSRIFIYDQTFSRWPPTLLFHSRRVCLLLCVHMFQTSERYFIDKWYISLISPCEWWTSERNEGRERLMVAYSDDDDAVDNDEDHREIKSRPNRQRKTFIACGAKRIDPRRK